MSLTFTTADWLALLGHFLSLSLLSVGGAISALPDMHRFLVDDRHWMTDGEFSATVAIAQVAPGPNVLFIALMGWNVGLSAAGWSGAWLGMFLALGGILIPSSVLTFYSARWSRRNHELRAVRAFKVGLSPVVPSLLMATAWILATGRQYDLVHAPVWAMAIITTLVVWRTRLHLLWLLGAGAVIGWFFLA